MQSAKETAANVTASARAGMEKTKATMQEKAEKMTTRDPMRKEMAEDKKDARIHDAERQKHEMKEAARAGGTTGQDYTTGYSTGTQGRTTGHDYTAGYPTGTQGGTTGHDYTTGYPTGTQGGTGFGYGDDQTTTGAVESKYPARATTGGGGRVGAQNPNIRGAGTGYQQTRDTDTF